jgi:SecD/SecF fusion protein
MQLKGLIKFFTVVFILVCAYQLAFTVMAKLVDNKAEAFAAKGLVLTAPSGLSGSDKINYEDSVSAIFKQKKRLYLDSVQNETAYNLGIFKYSYKECVDKQLNLGLDLKGGMSLVLEISEEDVLRKLSNNHPDVAFNKSVDEAQKIHAKEGGNFLNIFKQQYEKNAPNGQLANIFGALESYKGKINFKSSNEEVLKVIAEDLSSAVGETYNVLKTRIDQFGVGSPNISLQSNTGRIILELPGVEDPTRVRKILQQTAQLEFWDTYENEEIIGLIAQADIDLGTKLFNEVEGAEAEEATADTSAKGISLSDLTSEVALNDTSKKAGIKDSSNLYPIRKLLALQYDQQSGQAYEGPLVGIALGKDTATLNRYFSDEIVQSSLPRDLKLTWSAKPIYKEKSVFGLYAVKTRPGIQEAPLTGDVITDASKGFDQTGLPQVTLSMNSLGASKWEKMTEEAVNGVVNGKPRKKCVAIVLDNRVFSSPRVQSKIAGGNTQITGISDIQEAEDLANILKSGKLEARTRIIEEQVIGPSLGKESINSGVLSLVLGFVAVCLFMIFYYSTSSFIAIAAVLLNLFFIIGVLANFGAALTLPGLAGIVLTLAIAIDANVIINERIREELLKGKALKQAVTEGYKHSFSAIFDGNLTTLLVGIVLMFFGYGPIKGFAVTLVIGTTASMFTAFGLTSVIFDWVLDKKWAVSFGNNFTMNLFRGFKYHFIENRKKAYIFSSIIFTISLVGMFTSGFDLGVDFKGGRSYVVKFDKDVKTTEVASALEQSLGGKPLVKTYGSNSQLQITTAYLIEENSHLVDSLIESKLHSSLNKFYANDRTLESFRVKDIKSIQRIEPTIADDIRKSALLSGLIGLLGIGLYIYFRFKKMEYAFGAVIGLIHDPVLVLGLFSLLRHVSPFSMEIDQNVVAAILTLIGYSINDTVIVFDRIREHVKLYPTKSLIENVNDAINVTLSRTIMTSVATELVLVILFFFGGESVKTFSFAMIVGVAIGTYSSIYIAAPIMVDLLLRSNKKAEVKAAATKS